MFLTLTKRKFLKKKYFLFFTVFILSHCSSINSTVYVSPNIFLPSHDSRVVGINISINCKDLRHDYSLAKVVVNNKLLNLMSSRDLRFLFYEVIEKQMNARGYTINSNGIANLQIIINNLYAKIFQGDMKYMINAKADISVIVNINNNKITRNYSTIYTSKGIFQIKNKDISKSINNLLNIVIYNMANDNSIHNFIKDNI